MLFPKDATRKTSLSKAAATTYDVVIVGAGITGSILANQLARAGKHVLMLEAGLGEDLSLENYEGYLQRFYATAIKDNQSPYPMSANARYPRGDVHKMIPGQPDTSGYMVQTGPFGTDTGYTRVLGGTTMHWEAKTPRFLPEDFEMRSRFGVGLDWPVSNIELQPYLEMAEREIGVSADVADQTYLGTDFRKGYVFPMHGLPLSYLDKQVDEGLRGTSVELGGESFPLGVRPYPQGRNAIPNKAYDERQGLCARRRGLDQPGGGRRPLPGQQRLRADLPGAGKVQCRQDSGQGARQRPRRHSDANGRLARRRRWSWPCHGDRGQALPRCRFPCARGRERSGPHLRAQRQRDRDAPPHAGLRAEQHERARRPQPDGSRLPADLGADAAGLRHDAGHQLHRRHRRAARRRLPPAAGGLRRRTSTTTAGAGPKARPTQTSCAWWRRATSLAPIFAAPSSTGSRASSCSPSWSICRPMKATA